MNAQCTNTVITDPKHLPGVPCIDLNNFLEVPCIDPKIYIECPATIIIIYDLYLIYKT